MRRAEVVAEPALALAFLLFGVAGIVELVAISQSGSACREGAGWVMVLVLSVPFLWLGGVISLVVATRDRRFRGGNWTATGGIAAIMVALVFLPALVSQIEGCLS